MPPPLIFIEKDGVGVNLYERLRTVTPQQNTPTALLSEQMG